MSIVVAVRKGNKIAIAADSMTSCGSHRDVPDNVQTKKIRKIGSAVIGTTGWALFDNILDDMLVRKQNIQLGNKEAIFRFCMRLWKDLHDRYNFVNDQSQDSHTPFGDIDAQFLVASRGGLFTVASNLSVTEITRFYAIGGGSDYAFGALDVLYDSKASASEIAVHAVRTSINFDVYCGGDIDVLEVNVGLRRKK